MSQTKAWRLSLAVSLGAVLLVWIHRILTQLYPHLSSSMDITLGVTASLFKLAAIICVPFALSRVFIKCRKDKISALKAVAVWGFIALAFLAVLFIYRGPLAGILNNEAIRFYPTSLSSPQAKDSFNDLTGFVSRWNSGYTPLVEAGVVLACVGMLGLFAYRPIGNGWRSGAIAAVCTIIFMTSAATALHLIIWDYDIFLAGSLIAPLALDLVAPYIMINPATEIGSFCYFGLIWSCWILDTFILIRAGGSRTAPLLDTPPPLNI